MPMQTRPGEPIGSPGADPREAEQAHRQLPATADPVNAPFYAVVGIYNGSEALTDGDHCIYGATVYRLLPGGIRREVAFVDDTHEFMTNYEWADE